MAEPTWQPFFEPRHDAVLHVARGLQGTLEPLEESAEEDVQEAGRKAVAALAKAGLLKHVVPKAHGGSHESVEARAIVAAREGIAYASGLADALYALQGLGSIPLSLAGTDEQRKAWLPKVARGQAIAAFAVTEPEAGSDVASMTTRAKPAKEGWEITGTKTFISNAGIADYYALFVKTSPDAVSCLVVPADTKGIRVEPLRLMAPHPLGTVHFDRARVPRSALVGEEGKGLRIALATLDLMRPTVASAAVGFAQRALDEAIGRARTRRQFGRPLSENQGLRWKLADAATELQAARMLVHRAAWLKDLGRDRITLEAAQAKLFATEAAQRIVDLGLQVHGGTGVLHGAVVERLYREVRALRIYEGASEILRDVIARQLIPDAGRA